MFETKAQCIANCIKTERGMHVLFRSFGTKFVDSNAISLIKRDTQSQLSAFYPDVSMKSIRIIPSGSDELSKGHFDIDVNLGE